MKAFLFGKMLICFIVLGLPLKSPGAPLFPLPEDALAIQAIGGQLLSSEPICPEGVVCAINGTRLTFEFRLPGCLDEMGPFIWIYEDSISKLYISATNVYTQSSVNVYCLEPKVQKQTLDLVGKYPKLLEIIYLGTGLYQSVKLN